MNKKRLTYNPDDGSDNFILEGILECYRQLYPENLDGDLSHIRRTIAETERKLRGLFTALGRAVDEGDIYSWEMDKSEYNRKKREAESKSQKPSRKRPTTKKHKKKSL